MTICNHGLYEIAKDFQPAIAALVALCAAALAFRAAMARIEYDRRTATLERYNFRFGLALRLDMRAQRLHEAAQFYRKWAEQSKNADPDHFYRDLRGWPQEAEELDEAWAHIEILPQDAIESLEQLRDSQRGMSEYSTQEREERFDSVRPTAVANLCKRAETSSDQLREVLKIAIIDLHRGREVALRKV